MDCKNKCELNTNFLEHRDGVEHRDGGTYSYRDGATKWNIAEAIGTEQQKRYLK